MLLNEANTWLEKKITADQLDAIHVIYCLLDLDKEQFCKIVDQVGVDVLIEKRPHYERLAKAEKALSNKGDYLRKREETRELDEQIEMLVRKRKMIRQSTDIYERILFSQHLMAVAEVLQMKDACDEQKSTPCDTCDASESCDGDWACPWLTGKEV